MHFYKKVIVLRFCNARLKFFSVSFALSLPLISRAICEQLGPAKSNLNLQILPKSLNLNKLILLWKNEFY